jgi:5-amino-6-(5-phosphoribosylamino)uracil reductase
VRRLLPDPRDPVDPREAYAGLAARGDRPGVRVNMIASVDGATAVDGVSGPLGGPPDREIYRLLRSFADVVLVAAGTARAEGYKPARTYEQYQDDRRARGQADAPRIAVVSRSLDLDWAAPLFADADPPSIVVTTVDASPERLAAARAVAHVIAAGTGDVDLTAAVVALGALGARHVLCEGGPSLNAAMVAAGVVDELCLTISPLLAAGDAKRILAGPALAAPARLELLALLEQDGFLLSRYRVAPAA